MELELVRLRRVAKTKTSFTVDVRIDGEECRTRARVYPRQGYSVEFAEDVTAARLYKAGRRLRGLVGLIVAAYRGDKLQLPIRVEEHAAGGGGLVANTPLALVEVG